MATTGQGEAASYYNNTSAEQPQYAPPQAQPPPTYTPNAPPPNHSKQQQQYGGAPPPGPMMAGDNSEKLDFNQTFKVERPKWHDLWAGILLLLVFAGFIAVSGLTISGYDDNRGTVDGGGIYGSAQRFGLGSNT